MNDLERNSRNMDSRQQYIVSISAFTANGNLPNLKMELNAGLEAGLTVNEIREILVQLYAYCGFPRSLNSINTFMTVLEERKQKGLANTEGTAGEMVTGINKYEIGKKTLEQLVNMPLNGPLTGANAFAPAIDSFLKEHLFADIFCRGVLSYLQRELATISVLCTLRGVEAQLQAHFGMGMNVGLTRDQLMALIGIISEKIGPDQAEVSQGILDKVIESRTN